MRLLRPPLAARRGGGSWLAVVQRRRATAAVSAGFRPFAEAHVAGGPRSVEEVLAAAQRQLPVFDVQVTAMCR
ncbi:MAG: hypothetical protein ABIO70_25525 [Pseudomonadota bacterium]